MTSLPRNTDQLDETAVLSAATHAGAKRRIAVLEDQIQNLKEAGNKRKSYVMPGSFQYFQLNHS